MINLLKNLYNKAEDLKGQKLIFTLAWIFVLFTILGLLVGYFINNNLKRSELDSLYLDKLGEEMNPVTYYEGKVVYVNPSLYPGENISYMLESSKPEGVDYLLKSKDQKLSIAEGLNVKVSGKTSQSKKDNQPVIEVDKVIIKNVGN